MKVKKRKLMLLQPSLLNMSEYAWICLNKQDYALNMHRVLNMLKFWIWQGSQYASVTQPSEYARICLDRVLNISRVLDIPGFWIRHNITQNYKELHRITQELHRILNMPQCAWICLNFRQWTAFWICIIQYIGLGQSTSYWVLIER